MPNRILRDSALDSDRIAAVDEASEVLFYRLLMLADDFGRFDGRVSVIRARAYALRQAISEGEITKRLKALSEVGLVLLYESGGKRYLEIPRFDQRQRAKRSKFPDPPSDDGQLTVNSQTHGSHSHASRAQARVVDVGVGDDKAVGDIPGSRRKFADDDPATSPVDKLKGNGQILAYIPLNDGSEYPISEAMASELAKLYPAVDVPQTLNEIRGWNIANPTQRKTRTGILRHINAWMAKDQNRGS